MSRFDILMPAYNAAETIEESIQSVLNQTFSDWDLWVVDDGSTDCTADVVKPFLSDGRIHLVQQENKRLGAARNTGLRAGTAPLVCFLDSDDLWLSDKLERQNQAHLESGADVTFSDGVIFWDDGSQAEQAFQTVRGFLASEEMIGRSLLQNQLPVLSACVKRAMLESVGGFEETQAFHGVEDYDLWIRLAEAGASFFGIDAYLVRYRRHTNAMTSDITTRLMPRELAVWERHFELAQSLGLGAQIAAKIHLHHHVAALKMVERGEIRAARRLIGSAHVRRWESRSSVFKRAGIRLAPRVYVLIYNGLGRIKPRLRGQNE